MVGAGIEYNLVRSCCSRLEMLRVADSDLDSLPDDMLMQILLRIPAQDIHDSTMFVCWKWYDMIRSRNFIYTHLHHSSPVLLMATWNSKAISNLLSSTKGGIQCKISDFRSDYRRAYCWTSCNGLMMKRNLDDNLALTIVNPLTKQRLDLPRFYARTSHGQYPTNTSAIAYDATRMEYKVFRTYYLRVNKYNPMVHKHSTRSFCAVLTIGVDKSWRRVRTKHLSLTIRQHLRICPLVTQGFVHWTREYSRYVLTLNIQTEIITRIPVPTPCKGRRCNYLTGESYLSLLIGVACLKWEVWEMKPETGEWTKMPDIDLEPHKALLNELGHKVDNPLFKPSDGDCLDCKLTPDGWLKYRKIIVFGGFTKKDNKGGYYSPRVVYNIQTRDLYLLRSAASAYTPYVVHKNSLVRIPG